MYDTYIKNTGSPLWHICRCGEGCAGWLGYAIDAIRNIPNSYNSIIKSMRKHRNKQLDRNTNLGKNIEI